MRSGDFLHGRTKISMQKVLRRAQQHGNGKAQVHRQTRRALPAGTVIPLPFNSIMVMKTILETPRLLLREMTTSDLTAICRVLQDEKTMYAYEHAFSDEEAQAWLNNQLRRYREDGFGLWAVVLKESGEIIGQCGITLQDVNGEWVPEVGYLFERAYWHQGFATEAAIACKEYAFNVLGLDTVYSIIRDNNIASQNVAKRNGMTVCGRIVKHYYGMDMPHLVYRAERDAK